MPICEIDPWRTQYFDRVPCPDHVLIPTEDSDAWIWNPRHRWVYDKLAVAQSQGLAAAPHGVTPSAYPVFSKPIYNLKGMGVGSRALHGEADYLAAYQPGHFWSSLLSGDHVSSDVALVDGVPQWWRHARGYAGDGGTFDYWEVRADANAAVEDWAAPWCRKHLAGYTGMANLETIGGRIIEVHLRFADQWPDLYGGDAWVEAVVRLYEIGKWVYTDIERRSGYSVVLFLPHGRRYRHPPLPVQQEIVASPSISSLQISFHEDWPIDRHAMPPGGFRAAIVNCWDRAAGAAARDRLKAWFLASDDQSGRR
ncbi:hypothetical protein SAMN02745126_05884 [Enhydrobacter aerosaccus]|uniref:Uncharacterized protein n=1 Tax=Enhydrobacter aerosaccus TaxID=225324 RepID=A0A1T4TA94_9HYPH|nr:hypothetical protein [Enhydrobacter aerosaccus]SKA37098.1 hypothetical protein SAMN02745126_05884 [Enhydrobacter aerosaccus]